MMAAQMESNDKKISGLSIEVELFNITYPKFWKWVDHILYAKLGTRPTRSIATRRSGTSQIYQSFWENLTRIMGSSMGEMLQEQQSQQQPTATPIVQAGRREFYSDWTLASLMGYAHCSFKGLSDLYPLLSHCARAPAVTSLPRLHGARLLRVIT